MTSRKAALETERCSIQQSLKERTAALDALEVMRSSKNSLFKEWVTLVDREQELLPRATMECVRRVLRQAVKEAKVFIQDLVNMSSADVHVKAAEKVLEGVMGLLPAAAVAVVCHGDAGWRCPELDALHQRRMALEAELKSSDRVAVEQDLEELRRNTAVLAAQIASLKFLDSSGPCKTPLADVLLDEAYRIRGPFTREALGRIADLNHALLHHEPEPQTTPTCMYDAITPGLCKAAADGNLQYVNVLLAGRCEKGSRSTDGETPLHCAATNGQVEVVKVLLSAGCDKESKTTENWTPLHCVCVCICDSPSLDVE